jgi:hypothetical protein
MILLQLIMGHSKMRLLVLTSKIPCPQQKGDSARTPHHMEQRNILKMKKAPKKQKISILSFQRKLQRLKKLRTR